MVAISAPPGLSKTALSLFHTVDDTLSNAHILVFYGSTSSIPITTNSTSLRIQSHVFTPAGLQSYQRLVVAPNSPFYDAVACLSREDQGDEVVRAIAFSLFKYFSELPDALKKLWIARAAKHRPGSEPRFFTQAHAARLASRMVQVQDARAVITDIESALAAQSLSYTDIDLVLPPGVIINTHDSTQTPTGQNDTEIRYGEYAQLVKQFGEPVPIPSSKLRRAPSHPTALNRSDHFSKSQKEKLRREMCELVDTEENYLAKVYNLVHDFAENVRHRVNSTAPSPSNPDQEILSSLFPPSLDQILETNTAFFHATRELLEMTENEAIADIESTLDSSVPQVKLSFDTREPTGALLIANCLLDWFPKFRACYGAYISTQQDSGHILKACIRNPSSIIGSCIQEMGDQRLMSMLIEPVQRLPRYSLYLDNILKILPAKHLALEPFLKAKDIIADICAQDSASSSNSKILSNLRQVVPSWPSAFRPKGRIMTAIDVDELKAPFTPDSRQHNCKSFVLVVFAGYMVFLEKASTTATTARSLLAEVESQSTVTKLQNYHSGLVFSYAYSLMQVELTETNHDSLMRLSPSLVSSGTHIQDYGTTLLDEVRIFSLGGSFEGKAHRVVKDIVKARIEGRFPAELRDRGKVEIRVSESESMHMCLFAAVFEQDVEQTEGSPMTPSPIRILVGVGGETSLRSMKREGVDVAVAVLHQGEGFYCLEIMADSDRGTRDIVTSTEFIPVLTKRLGNIMQLRNTIRNPLVATYLMQNNEDILQSLKIRTSRDPSITLRQPAPPRSPSPVKLLSHLFTGPSSKENINPLGPERPLLTTNIPQFSPPVPYKATYGQPEPPISITHATGVTFEVSKDVFTRLERILNTYILALRARKGNVIGRVLASRGQANEATVNELYNSLLEHPSNHENPAQAPVDVLFAAFEKFLNNAWKEKFGPLVVASTLRQLRTKLETLEPHDYEEYLGEALRRESPQNQRALDSLLALIADLMSGTTNDADRGALTAALAEIVVNQPDSHDFISLFDYMISDRQVVTEPGVREVDAGIMQNSFGSSIRNDMSHGTGSIGSKASLLSRRLGFGSLRRDNSKSDYGKTGSGLRAWSKIALATDGNNKSSLLRTKSVDLGTGLSSQHRLQSRDRTQMAGVSEQPEDDVPRTGRSLDQIEKSRAQDNESVAQQKKKRRSSLSDLNELLQQPGANAVWMSSKPKAIPGIPQRSPLISQIPSSNKAIEKVVPAATTAKEITIPNRAAEVPRPPPNTNELASNLPALPRPRPVQQSSDPFCLSGQIVMGLATAGKPTTKLPSGIPRHQRSPSNMPIPKGVLSSTSGNTPPPPPVPAKSPRKAGGLVSHIRPPPERSPSKLRDKLQTQQETVTVTSTSLQAELFKIGEELTALRIDQPAPLANTYVSASGSPQKREQQLVSNLNTRLRALETKLPHQISNLERQMSSLGKEYESALQASQRHVRGLEAKLREATAENLALYGRYDREMEAVFAQVKDGKGSDALQVKLKEALHEASRWRKQSQKLAKENVELKALAGRE